MPEGTLRGIVPAIVTPFRPDERIDYKTWQELIEVVLASGVHGLLVNGGQGEFFALNEEEREVAARFCTQTAAQRVPVYVNVGAVTTQESVRLAQKAEADGADVIVVVTPYYLRPSADELVEHFIEVARSVRLPMMVYTIPERTGVDVSLEIIRRVSALCENFAGLLDSSGMLDRIRACTEAGVTVFMGRDQLLLEGLRNGAAGLVSGCANIAPKAIVELYDAFQAGDTAKAERIQSLIQPLRATFASATFPVVLKEALCLAGVNVGRCRRPVGAMPEAARQSLVEALAALRAEDYLVTHVKLSAS